MSVSSAPCNSLDRAPTAATVPASSRTPASALPLGPNNPLARPPALRNPIFLRSNNVAAPSLMAPLIKSAVSFLSDRPMPVPKRR